MNLTHLKLLSLNKMKKVYLILLLITGILSCNKMKTSKYSGVYIGKSDTYSWNMINGVTTDTTYSDTLEIISEGDYLLIYWQKKYTLIVSKRMLLTLKI